MDRDPAADGSGLENLSGDQFQAAAIMNAAGLRLGLQLITTWIFTDEPHITTARVAPSTHLLTGTSMELRTDRHLPDFLGIGAARSGTTWLHSNLNSHPQVWLPPIKEVHYFDAERPGAWRHFPITRVSQRFAWAHWRWFNSKVVLYRLLRGKIRPAWALRYLFGRRSDQWYRKLFRPDRFTGEITPGYMLMPPVVAEQVRELNPELKILVMLRDPVTRAWSQVRNGFRNRRSTPSDAEVRQRADSQGVVLRSLYTQSLRNWMSVFPREQILISFFDELQANPAELLSRIQQFLEIPPNPEASSERAEKPVYSAPKLELPDDLRRHMYATYLDDLRQLVELLGPSPADKWLETAEAAVSS